MSDESERPTRIERELEYHDRVLGSGEGESDDGRWLRKGRRPYRYAIQTLLDSIEDIRGAHILEVGSGTGWGTRRLIEHGAGRVSAFDLSGEAVHQAAGKYRDWGIADRVDVVQMAAERLAYRSESFDAAVGNAILHHVDLDLALPELARVLKPGGRGYFMEPLAHNPLINLYRKRTPEARTEDERPFRFRDIEGFGRYFSKVSHRPVYLVTPIAMMSALVIKSDAFFERMLSLMWKLDGPTLKVLPFLKKMCWVTVVTLEK